jgi:hypothetical protein
MYSKPLETAVITATDFAVAFADYRFGIARVVAK